MHQSCSFKISRIRQFGHSYVSPSTTTPCLNQPEKKEKKKKKKKKERKKKKEKKKEGRFDTAFS